MPRPTHITINLGALKHNARVARSLSDDKKMMAAVKANAYGHGLSACAHALAPVMDAFAVAVCEEATELREMGIKQPILILEGPFDLDDCHTIIKNKCWTVIHSFEQIELLEGLSASDKRALADSVWLKLDTGMHRLGIAISDITTALSRLRSLGIDTPTLVTHLANAERQDSSLNLEQLKKCREVTQGLSMPTSLLNSAGLIHHLSSECDWHRLGYMLYGGSAAARMDITPLLPVMAMNSEVMALRSIPAGDSVGYGGRWTAERDSMIATIAVGYGDGYPRTARNGTPVYIDGQICPLVGRVSMDMITVDVTDHASVRVGSAAQLWGDKVSVDTVAEHAQTIGYELLTRLPDRTPRQLIDEA